MHGKMKNFKSEPDDGTQKAVLEYEWKLIHFAYLEVYEPCDASVCL